MKRLTLAVLIAAILCLTAFAGEKNNEFQTGTIVDVQKLPAKDPSAGSGTDAPAGSDVYRWDVSVQIGDTVYKARWKRYDPSSLGWIKGKEVQVRTKGNVLYLKKDDGTVVRGSIVGKTKA